MKFNYVNSKKIIAILLSSVILTSCSNYETVKDNNVTNEAQISSSDEINIKETSNVSLENSTTNNTIENIENNHTKNNHTNIENANESKSNNNDLNNINETNVYNENDLKVINTLNNLENDTNELIKNENTSDKLKGIFITIVDFIFYDSEIDGVKFDDLTLEAKQKVLEIAYNIDSKIENKFPNYKDNISDKTKIAFNKVSEIIKIGANNINDFSKDLLGDNYYTLIEAKDSLVYYTKNAIDIIGNFSSKTFNSGKEYIKNWYENFKQKNQD